ncbi:MAG TPA: UDP-N-acetylmuramate dehydrogenase [Acidobacteriaceae bacterium]|nr:UDP-N-acetylmuramate dehydrogenase [Acidobacteriaceae bacterium]
MQFLEQVPLAPYTTFQIGGPARWFAQAENEDDIVAGIAFATERRLPLFILGGGSNLLISDAGFPGLVLRIALSGITSILQGDRHVISAAAGEDWDGLVAFAVSQDCAGIECLSGIPGTVGGTPVQNVGAYGQEVSQTIVTVRAFDRENSNFLDLPASACGFSYRRSIFNTTERGRYVVSRVDYALQPHASAGIAYADLSKYFAARNVTTPTLAEVREAVRSIRAQKGMLLVDGDPDCRSAGSFFKNPIVPVTVLDSLARDLGIEKRSIPAYPVEDSEVKLSAAWLIERAGYQKGYALGNAGISSRHTLALINRGGATAAEMIALRDKIASTVAGRFLVRLEPEPVWLG